MEFQISHDQMRLLLETIGNVLDKKYSKDLCALYLRLLLQAKDEGVDIATLNIGN